MLTAGTVVHNADELLPMMRVRAEPHKILCTQDTEDRANINMGCAQHCWPRCVNVTSPVQTVRVAECYGIPVVKLYATSHCCCMWFAQCGRYRIW